jgi:hypothetical protein
MKGWFSRRRDRDCITVVSGLPRSGTSLMMRMLDAGGLAPVTDGERTADEDNPRGYYELERVKQLPKGDFGWLDGARGKVVKIISALLVFLPDSHRYRVIFLRREMSEVLASQRKMLERRGEDPDRLSDEKLAALFEKHLAEAEAWMARHEGNLSVLQVSFNDLVREPKPEIERIVAFLGVGLDPDAMGAVVEPKLYRQRADSSRES